MGETMGVFDSSITPASRIRLLCEGIDLSGEEQRQLGFLADNLTNPFDSASVDGKGPALLHVRVITPALWKPKAIELRQDEKVALALHREDTREIPDINEFTMLHSIWRPPRDSMPKPPIRWRILCSKERNRRKRI